MDFLHILTAVSGFMLADLTRILDMLSTSCLSVIIPLIECGDQRHTLQYFR